MPSDTSTFVRVVQPCRAGGPRCTGPQEYVLADGPVSDVVLRAYEMPTICPPCWAWLMAGMPERSPVSGGPRCWTGER